MKYINEDEIEKIQRIISFILRDIRALKYLELQNTRRKPI